MQQGISNKSQQGQKACPFCKNGEVEVKESDGTIKKQVCPKCGGKAVAAPATK